MRHFLFIALIVFSSRLYSAEKKYHLIIENKIVNFTGVEVDHALGIRLHNQEETQIPAPTLRFKKNDMAIIKVENLADEAVSLHWHGLLVPWNMDGPPFVNNKLIQPNESFTFKFPIKHTGTFWYHSHTELQEQRGLFGGIVIEDEDPPVHFDKDEVLVLSDWIDEHPKDVLSNLKKNGDYYSYKKKFFPNLYAVLKHGKVKEYLQAEWSKMGPMDLSDVGYDLFLLNGKNRNILSSVQGGQKIRLRVINAAASSYFYLNLGNQRAFTLIEKDGQKVEPIKIQEILIGVGETYDLLIEIPHHYHQPWEFRATSMDVTGYSNLILGEAEDFEKVPDQVLPFPYYGNHSNHQKNLMPPDHGGGGGHHHHHEMKESTLVKRLDVSMIKSTHKTAYSETHPRHHVLLQLTGNMDRYIWSINGKISSDDPYIDVNENDVVQFSMINKTMMHHSMHLHGHFFRVINGQGDRSPLFHTVDVPPMGETKIEFFANEPGIWFFHCHNLYHMKLGMSRLVRYKNFKRPKDLIEDEKKYKGNYLNDKTFFPMGLISLRTNQAELNLNLSGGNWDIDLNLEVDEYDEETFEGELYFRRSINRFLNIFTGARFEDNTFTGILGLAYTLPMRIETTSFVQNDGKVIVRMRKEIPLLYRLDLEIEPEFEYFDDEVSWQIETGVNYQVSPSITLGPYFKKNEEIGNSLGFGFSVLF